MKIQIRFNHHQCEGFRIYPHTLDLTSAQFEEVGRLFAPELREHGLEQIFKVFPNGNTSEVWVTQPTYTSDDEVIRIKSQIEQGLGTLRECLDEVKSKLTLVPCEFEFEV